MVANLVLRAGVVLLLAGVIYGQDYDPHDKLIGSWRASAADASGAVWVLEAKADNIHVTQSQGGQAVVEFECNTMGRECEVKDNGKRAKVSMWFNGPALVAMETRGSDVTKRRFTILEQGDTMEVEVTPIVPAGKAEVVKLQRVPVSVAYR